MKNLVHGFVMSVLVSASTFAADSATIIPGTFVQGTVKPSLAVAGYQNTAINLGNWQLTTGGNFAISYENPQFKANSLIAFGNGGTMTLQLNTPITPIVGEKDLGIFTAQGISGSGTPGAFFNGNMDTAILVSADDQHWYNLSGQLIANPTTYSAQSYSLNAPTMAYSYTSGANAWAAGTGSLGAAGLAALSIANFTTPMPDDSLFNTAASTNAQRFALSTDTSPADYANAFGSSGGGNWFDISGSGLSAVDYIMLNGDPNDPATGAVRLQNIFINQNAVQAVPEPVSFGLLASAGVMVLPRRAKRSRLDRTASSAGTGR